ncbi:MAG: UbiD family decarboxylase [Thermoplasmataceae archaeon]
METWHSRNDLREFISRLRELNIIRDVEGADTYLEIGALTDLNAKSNRYALLFDRIKGYKEGFRVLTGSLLDARRVALALNLNPDLNDMGLVSVLRERIKSAQSSFDKYLPVSDESSPIFENRRSGNSIDLSVFPAPQWFKNDGGKYIGTADAVVTKDPENGWINVGTYRVMVKDGKRLAILIEASRHARQHVQKYWKRGEDCPVAISFGHNPGINLFAGIEVPEGVSEYSYLGAVRQEPVHVVSGPVTGLPIPADSEIAIEGYITQEKVEEGPLGEFMGYYAGGKMMNPLIRVEAVYFRNDPILLGTCAGKPPYDYSYFRCPIRSAMIWNALDSAGISGVSGVWCHEEGYSRAFNVVSIKQLFGGHAVMAGHVASQCRPGAISGRYTVVVDDDIDPSNLSDVVWAMSSRTDTASGIHIIHDTVGTPLDPISEHIDGKDILEYTSSRAVILATKPFEKIVRNTFPEVVRPDQKTEEAVREKFRTILRKE